MGRRIGSRQQKRRRERKLANKRERERLDERLEAVSAASKCDRERAVRAYAETPPPVLSEHRTRYAVGMMTGHLHQLSPDERLEAIERLRRFYLPDGSYHQVPKMAQRTT